jgi:excisionase family DNA binding protein
MGSTGFSPAVVRLTLEEVAATLRISKTTTRRLVDRGELPYTRIPGTRRLLFDPADVQRLFDENRVDQTGTG